MSYIGAAVLILFLLGLTSAGWYWLFKRFEQRVSERFDDVAERTNENFRIIEMVIGKVDDLPKKTDRTNEMLHELKHEAEKLDMLQGLLLVIKQDRFLNAALNAGQTGHKEGKVSDEEIEQLKKLLHELRLENFSRY